MFYLPAINCSPNPLQTSIRSENGDLIFVLQNETSTTITSTVVSMRSILAENLNMKKTITDLQTQISTIYGSNIFYSFATFKVQWEFPTVGAFDWKFFQIGNDSYLAVANRFSSLSRIYKWNGVSFEVFQELPISGAIDWEYFLMNTTSYLALANSNSAFSSLYKFNGTSFILFQQIPSYGAWDVDYTRIDNQYYLAFANYFNGSSYNLMSYIYKWDGATFQLFQQIPSSGARGWNFFQIGNNHYVTLTNAYNESQDSYNCLSRIYKWNGVSFNLFQEIPTVGANRLKSFHR